MVVTAFEVIEVVTIHESFVENDVWCLLSREYGGGGGHGGPVGGGYAAPLLCRYDVNDCAHI